MSGWKRVEPIEGKPLTMYEASARLNAAVAQAAGDILLSLRWKWLEPAAHRCYRRQAEAERAARYWRDRVPSP